MAFTLLETARPTGAAVTHRPAALPRRIAERSVRQGPAHVIMLALAALAVVPLVWLVITAFASPDSIAAGRPFDGLFSLRNIDTVLTAIPLLEMFANTVVMALAITLSQLLVALLAAYGFATFQFRGRKLLYLLFVGSWLVPFQVTMIPNYVLISQLGLLNTVAGIIVPNLCSAFAVLMLRQHVRSIPRDLLDAASIDGRGGWATLWLVIVPNLRPALASLAVILFISAWNEYLWPLLVMQSDDGVLQVGIRSFLSAEGNDWGAIMAASGIACLPVFALYLFLQRQIVEGFVRSGIK